jgi:DNA recombination protein RmuC
MSPSLEFVGLAAAGAINLVLLLVLLWRSRGGGQADVRLRIEALERAQERVERAVRDELVRSRDEAGQQSRELRTELGTSLRATGDSTLQHLGEMTRIQKSQFDSLLEGLARMAEANHGSARKLREEVTASVRGMNDSIVKAVGELGVLQKGQLESFSTQLARLTESNERKLESLRSAVDNQLQQIREDNRSQLDQMRHTVDEKLQGALEQRLGESFRLVSDRLEKVHQGLGEMQNLANGVGDLKRVLANVKVRGTWGEVQLAGLLEQVLTPEQYAVNVATRPGSGERVEFAIKLPGRADSDEPVWLPIDAKFPQEDYIALVEAQERSDTVAAEAAAKKLETRIRGCAREICDKYINPPVTTDFAIMFLPTEGLYAESIRRPGLIELIQREHRIVVAGPTTLAALLNSLQMGFRTLAIQKRSGEVWSVLGAVKTEFGKFGSVLDRVKKKLEEANNVVESAQTRTRVMSRKLRDVEELEPVAAETLLLGPHAQIVSDGVEEADIVAASAD